MTSSTAVQLPTFSSYGNYSSSNYGAHTLCFTDAAGNEFFFSYKTLVAVRFATDRLLLVRRNVWGPTTGKHLNWIDGGDASAKADRVDADAFAVIVETRLS